MYPIIINNNISVDELRCLIQQVEKSAELGWGECKVLFMFHKS